MPLDPDVQCLLDATRRSGVSPPDEIGALAARLEMRRLALALGPPPFDPRLGSVENLHVPIPGRTLEVRLYRPTGDGPFPVLLYFHGGGWVLGDLDTHDSLCRRLAAASGVLVVAVGYRLAPEHRFPAAADDARDVLAWVARAAEEIGGDPARICVGGDSAGGNLAAVAALSARAAGGPALRGQLLIYPIADCDLETPSYRAFADGYLLTARSMRWFWDQYVPDPRARTDWRASPLRAPSLDRLPPAYVVTAEYDPLRDEGEAYAERLRVAGVPVVLERQPGLVHGFVRQAHIVPRADAALSRIAGVLRRWLGTDAAPGG